MAYTAWSVVAFEQPTAAKWNILGTNDAAFRDGSGVQIDSTNLDTLLDVTGSVLKIGGTGLAENAVRTMAKARAYSGSAQDNLTSGTPTKVNIDTETYDVGGDFDTTNKRFVPPVTGYYAIVGNIGFTTNVDATNMTAAINVAGATVAQVRAHAASNVALYIPVHDIRLLTATTDYVELFATSNSGANTADIVSGSTATFLSVHLLSVD